MSFGRSEKVHAKSGSSSSMSAKSGPSGRVSAKSAQFSGGNLAKTSASGATPKEGEAAGAVMDDFASQTKENKEALTQAVNNALTITTKAIANTKLGNATYMLYMDAAAKEGATDAAVTGRVATVAANYAKIKSSLENQKVIFKKWDIPADDSIKEADTYAYVRPGEASNNMYLGGMFWVSPALGVDSQAGTILHEVSHRVAGTTDHTYGIANSKSNAATDAGKAAENADNYEHFAEMS